MKTARDLLLTYQVAHVDALLVPLRKYGVAFDPSDAGTGKTYTGTTAAIELGADIFVISPKAAIETWFNVATILGASVIGVTNYELLKVGKYYMNAEDYYADRKSLCPIFRIKHIVRGLERSIEYVWTFNRARKAMIIIDEAHRGKNVSAIAELMCSTKGAANYLLLLSATIADKLSCFRTPAYLLGLSQYEKYAFKTWLANIGGTAQDINAILFPTYGARMSIKEIQASAETKYYFPNNDIRAEVYEMSEDAEAIIEAEYASIKQAADELRDRVETNDGPYIVKMNFAHQRIELAKVPVMAKLAAQRLDAGDAVIIFINFTETTAQLVKLLAAYGPISYINGEQTTTARCKHIHDFQMDTSKLMIAQIRAGGISISLHNVYGYRARYVIISPPRSAIDLRQALSRAARAGSKTPCIQRIVYCKGSLRAANVNRDAVAGVEEQMAATLNEKMLTIEWLNSRDDGDVRIL